MCGPWPGFLVVLLIDFAVPGGSTYWTLTQWMQRVQSAASSFHAARLLYYAVAVYGRIRSDAQPCREGSSSLDVAWVRGCGCYGLVWVGMGVCMYVCVWERDGDGACLFPSLPPSLNIVNVTVTQPSTVADVPIYKVHTYIHRDRRIVRCFDPRRIWYSSIIGRGEGKGRGCIGLVRHCKTTSTGLRIAGTGSWGNTSSAALPAPPR
ncbi:hypothetical protein GGS23DRAFT_113471 [Durotheca rogersii]|uniref:uncharacterized protein n=1 Tax=Durotheca rogersii TaxID=419775 RepID=UPI00221F653C|nr:uncharacterized protein GGS23DRAFT_113471 [Durotheca rogersii]KAI5862243.1 hypothetical protein GGS23DRAFT_113471 [Durotheca rogersii]